MMILSFTNYITKVMNLTCSNELLGLLLYLLRTSHTVLGTHIMVSARQERNSSDTYSQTSVLVTGAFEYVGNEIMKQLSEAIIRVRSASNNADRISKYLELN
jgi:hypothetical protein